MGREGGGDREKERKKERDREQKDTEGTRMEDEQSRGGGAVLG